ncbi:MAG: hypothetical protein M1819_000647 [Sarea resinae]|nr:MAG: hypothetical protein M1819_000647 [Sarea resinae]
MVLGLLTIAAIPTTIGVCEGVSQQKEKNKQDADAERLAKFHADVFCGARSSKRRFIHGSRVVLRNDKAYLQKPSQTKPAAHPLSAFYIQYPDEEREATRGLVSTIAYDPPMLNWLYVDKDTLEVKYGNRTQSRQHHVGPWDWTEPDQEGLTFEGREQFVAVREEDEGDEEDGPEGGVWALFFDRNEDHLKSLGEKRPVLEISLERKLLPKPEELKKMEEDRKK